MKIDKYIYIYQRKKHKVLPAGHFEVKRSSNERKEETVLSERSKDTCWVLEPIGPLKKAHGCKEPSRVGGMETAL